MAYRPDNLYNTKIKNSRTGIRSLQARGPYGFDDLAVPYHGSNYDYSEGMLNTPDKPEILNIARGPYGFDDLAVPYHGSNYDYSQGMLNTPQTAETLNIARGPYGFNDLAVPYHGTNYDYSQGMLNTPQTAETLNFRASIDDEEPYDFSGIRGQTAMIPGLMDPFSIYAMTKAGLGKKQIVSYLARKEAQQGILKDIETKKAAAAAEEKAAADRKAQQQATIAANREAAKKFGDKPQPIYHQETKSQDRGGRDIGSRVSDSYEKQQSAQYGMLAKGGLVNLFKYGGFLG